MFIFIVYLLFIYFAGKLTLKSRVEFVNYFYCFLIFSSIAFLFVFRDDLFTLFLSVTFNVCVYLFFYFFLKKIDKAVSIFLDSAADLADDYYFKSKITDTKKDGKFLKNNKRKDLELGDVERINDIDIENEEILSDTEVVAFNDDYKVVGSNTENYLKKKLHEMHGVDINSLKGKGYHTTMLNAKKSAGKGGYKGAGV